MSAPLGAVGAAAAMVASAVDRAEQQLDRWQVPGLQVAVVRGTELLFGGGIGIRGIHDPRAVTSRTMFHHGSCAKAYTALLAGVLHESGVLDLDAPVRRLVPELELPDPLVRDRVTVRDLLSHRSGLGRHDMVWIGNPSWSSVELVRRLAHLQLAGDFRVSMDYTNLGYALAGLAIERAGNALWQAQLDDRLLRPAGLNRASGHPLGPEDDDYARPHRLDDSQVAAIAWRSMDGVAPAGQLLTSAEDSARWLQLQLGALEHSGVDPAAIRRTHQIHVGLPADLGPIPELHLLGYGLGWVVALYGGRRVLWHSGGVDGFLTQTMLVPDAEIGVSVCANLHFSDLPFAVVLDLVDALLGERHAPDGSWYERLAKHDTEAETPLETSAARHAHSIGSYAGRYAHPGYGELRVGTSGDSLQVRYGQCRLRSWHRNFETWQLSYVPLDLQIPLTFRTDVEGRVRAAAVEFDEGSPVLFTRQEVSG